MSSYPLLYLPSTVTSCCPLRDRNREICGADLAVFCFRKQVLSLKRYSLEATLSGNTINLVSNDAQKVKRSLNQLGMVLAAQLELTISLVILWYLIGCSASHRAKTL